MEKHEISKWLLQEYVGYEEGGQLTPTTLPASMCLRSKIFNQKENYWHFIPHKGDILKKLFRIKAFIRIADMSFF